MSRRTRKSLGLARYAYEYEPDAVAYAFLVTSAVARGRIVRVDAAPALALDGVFAVLCHENAPRLDEADGELAVLQSPRVAYRGQIVAAVIADTLEAAREGAARVEIAYDEEPARVVLEAGDPALYAPPKVNPSFETDTEAGDVDAALKAASVIVDETYETPAFHNNPMEPHATIAMWEADGLTLHDSTQGVSHAGRDRPRFRARAVAGACDRAARGRRIWLQGHSQASRGRRRAGGARRRAAGQARCHAAADVRARGLPHADDPAPPPGEPRAMVG